MIIFPVLNDQMTSNKKRKSFKMTLSTQSDCNAKYGCVCMLVYDNTTTAWSWTPKVYRFDYYGPVSITKAKMQEDFYDFFPDKWSNRLIKNKGRSSVKHLPEAGYIISVVLESDESKDFNNICTCNQMPGTYWIPERQQAARYSSWRL